MPRTIDFVPLSSHRCRRIIDKDSLLKVLLRILPRTNPLTTTKRKTKAEKVNDNDVVDET